MRKCVLCHMRTKKAQISAFVVCCLDSILSLDSIAEISRLTLASVAAQAGLCLVWSETAGDTFCRVVAHMIKLIKRYRTLLEMSPTILCVITTI